MILTFIRIKSTLESRDILGMNPIKDIISSLFVWPLASVGQFNETDFQWRQVLPEIMVISPEQGLFDISVGNDPSNKTKRMLIVCNYYEDLSS